MFFVKCAINNKIIAADARINICASAAIAYCKELNVKV